jgi:phosphopantetheine adenylyltransferase
VVEIFELDYELLMSAINIILNQSYEMIFISAKKIIRYIKFISFTLRQLARYESIKAVVRYESIID